MVVPRNAARRNVHSEVGPRGAKFSLYLHFSNSRRRPFSAPLSLSLCWNSANKSPRIGGEPRPRPRISLAALFPECSPIVFRPEWGAHETNPDTWMRISRPSKITPILSRIASQPRWLLRPPLTRLVHALRYNECITRCYQPAINRGAGARTKVPTRRVANITGLLLCIGDKALIKGTAGFAVGVCRPFFLFLIFNFWKGDGEQKRRSVYPRTTFDFSSLLGLQRTLLHSLYFN